MQPAFIYIFKHTQMLNWPLTLLASTEHPICNMKVTQGCRLLDFLFRNFPKQLVDVFSFPASSLPAWFTASQLTFSRFCICFFLVQISLFTYPSRFRVRSNILTSFSSRLFCFQHVIFFCIHVASTTLVRYVCQNKTTVSHPKVRVSNVHVLSPWVTLETLW